MIHGIADPLPALWEIEISLGLSALSERGYRFVRLGDATLGATLVAEQPDSAIRR